MQGFPTIESLIVPVPVIVPASYIEVFFLFRLIQGTFCPVGKQYNPWLSVEWYETCILFCTAIFRAYMVSYKRLYKFLRVRIILI